ncbi:thiamine ABC transporter ATP-binding protein, partial [Candidatus Regiella insecticola]
MITLRKITYLSHNLPIHFNLNIQTGERVAILGPSGAGKSSLLNLIAGFLIPSSGHILLNHQNHTLTPPANRPVSMLFQENNLFSHLTVKQNIALGSHPGLKLNAAQHQRLLQIIEQVGLTAYLNRLPAQLFRRTTPARCMIRSQPILLLDEPFSALDPALRNEM